LHGEVGYGTFSIVATPACCYFQLRYGGYGRRPGVPGNISKNTLPEIPRSSTSRYFWVCNCASDYLLNESKIVRSAITTASDLATFAYACRRHVRTTDPRLQTYLLRSVFSPQPKFITRSTSVSQRHAILHSIISKEL
jgi:hypothetical protein